jgi:hypothetical protein
MYSSPIKGKIKQDYLSVGDYCQHLDCP